MPAQSPAVGRRSASLSAASLPMHTLRIFGACALSLILWFSAGRVVRALLMVAASEVSHGDYRQVRLVITMFVFTLIVLNELVIMVGMLHSVRGALREIRARREGGEADESMFGALNRATLVFATIYLAWSFQNADAREFIGVDTARRVDQDFASSLAGNGVEGGTGLSTLDVRVSLGVAVVAYLLKALFGWWHVNGKVKGSGVFATFFELAFAFYSLNALFAFAEARADWLDHRVAVTTVKDWAEAAGEAVPWWKTFWDAVGDVWPHVIDGLVVPLTWLTVASLVYGAFAEDTRAVVRGDQARQRGHPDGADAQPHPDHDDPRHGRVPGALGSPDERLPARRPGRSRAVRSLLSRLCRDQGGHRLRGSGRADADRQRGPVRLARAGRAGVLRQGTGGADADRLPAGGHVRHRGHPQS
ncbi:hypothetical protein [Streptosporangium vulgare]|uniref:hypothetical protein n=1 Tax=Streptosporangium vulgare TaxID=46190 RepID=UPI0031E0D4D8